MWITVLIRTSAPHSDKQAPGMTSPWGFRFFGTKFERPSAASPDFLGFTFRTDFGTLCGSELCAFHFHGHFQSRS
ncbi:protein of unknown function [Pararobbsia alpina]